MPSSGVQTCALRSEEHTSELQSLTNLVCRLLLENKENTQDPDALAQIQGRSLVKLPVQGLISLPVKIFLAETVNRHSHIRQPYTLLFFLNDPATPEIYTLTLHDALPISTTPMTIPRSSTPGSASANPPSFQMPPDRKSTRLNSSHDQTSYAVFCLKKRNSSVPDSFAPKFSLFFFHSCQSIIS